MISSSKQHGNKNIGSTNTAPDTSNVTKMGHVNTDMIERTANTPSLKAYAARSVFNTVILG
jgi:hypothetical protein